MMVRPITVVLSAMSMRYETHVFLHYISRMEGLVLPETSPCLI